LESASLAKASGTDATETIHAAAWRRRLVDAVVVSPFSERGRSPDSRLRPGLCAREFVCFCFNRKPSGVETRYVAAGRIWDHPFVLRVWIFVWLGQVLEPLDPLDAYQHCECVE